MHGREFLPCAVAHEANILKQFRLAVPRTYPGVAITAPLKEPCRQRADRAAHHLPNIPPPSKNSFIPRLPVLAQRRHLIVNPKDPLCAIFGTPEPLHLRRPTVGSTGSVPCLYQLAHTSYLMTTNGGNDEVSRCAIVVERFGNSRIFRLFG
jgi:hypothetical protein